MGWTKIRHGRDQALKELERYYEGPLKGLEIGAQFYKMLGSNDLKNTPLGRSLALQQQLLGEVSAGLGGQAFGRTKGRPGAGVLPPDLVSAIGENLNMQSGQLGLDGSPANAIRAAMRYSGASEDIRAQRINSGLNVLNTVGRGSIMPDASQFLNLGAQKAESAAAYQYKGAMDMNSERERQRAGRSQMYGQIAGMAGSGLLGGFAAPAGMFGAGVLGGITGTGYQRFGGSGGGQPRGFGLEQMYNQQYNGSRPFLEESWRFGP